MGYRAEIAQPGHFLVLGDDELTRMLHELGHEYQEDGFWSLTVTRWELEQSRQYFLHKLGIEHKNYLVTLGASAELKLTFSSPNTEESKELELMLKLGILEKHLALGGSDLVWY